MTNNANVHAIEHTDVRGKKQLYLKIENKLTGLFHLINVGEKTFKAVVEILHEEKKLKEPLTGDYPIENEENKPNKNKGGK